MPVIATRARRIEIILFICVVGSIVLDYALAGPRSGDDWSRYDGKSFRFVSVIDGESIRLAGVDAPVKLLGARPFDGDDWNQRAADWLAKSLAGKTLVLHLEPSQTRDDSGRLMACVFSEPGDLIDLDIVTAGIARADRRVPCAYLGEIELAQSEARRKGLGFWVGQKLTNRASSAAKQR
ncbi:MAG: thermonuclease family protein [Tepidisphaeraceae bacterium]|jgi:endonuclease YncB( thermonuclease family)